MVNVDGENSHFFPWFLGTPSKSLTVRSHLEKKRLKLTVSSKRLMLSAILFPMPNVNDTLT